MVSTVRSQPNHYEALGVSPTASSDEILKAFGRRMGMFNAHSLASTAEMSVAFEVLRDPERRRAYDREIGIGSPAEQRKWVVSGAIRSSAPFLGSDWRRPDPFALSHKDTKASDPVAVAAQAASGDEQPESGEPRDEPRLASFLASSLREPPRRAPQPETIPAPVQRPPNALEQEIERILAPRRVHQLALEDDHRQFDWKRPAAAIGVILAGAGMIGAFAGMSVKDAEQAQLPNAAVTVGLPAPRLSPEPATPSIGSASTGAMAQASGSERPRAPARTTPREPPSRFAKEAVAEGASAAAALASGPAPVDAALAADTQPTVTEPADALAPTTTQPVAAKLPLSGATIASTIRRIGYPCGSVIATSHAGGGVFSVTCSSGDTYRASPVRGRYHFRRSGSH